MGARQRGAHTARVRVLVSLPVSSSAAQPGRCEHHYGDEVLTTLVAAFKLGCWGDPGPVFWGREGQLWDRLPTVAAAGCAVVGRAGFLVMLPPRQLCAFGEAWVLLVDSSSLRRMLRAGNGGRRVAPLAAAAVCTTGTVLTSGWYACERGVTKTSTRAQTLHACGCRRRSSLDDCRGGGVGWPAGCGQLEQLCRETAPWGLGVCTCTFVQQSVRLGSLSTGHVTARRAVVLHPTRQCALSWGWLWGCY